MFFARLDTRLRRSFGSVEASDSQQRAFGRAGKLDAYLAPKINSVANLLIALFASVDGLKGFPDAIATAKGIGSGSEADLSCRHGRGSGTQAGTEFEARWDARYSSIGKLWRRHWAGVVGLFSFLEEIRKAIYTTNVVKSLNMMLRKVIKTRVSFRNQESALKLIYLALRNVSQRWRSAPSWRIALNHFMLLWGDRVEAAQQRPTR